MIVVLCCKRFYNSKQSLEHSRALCRCSMFDWLILITYKLYTMYSFYVIHVEILYDNRICCLLNNKDIVYLFFFFLQRNRMAISISMMIMAAPTAADSITNSEVEIPLPVKKY